MADSRKIQEVVMANGGIQQTSHSMLPVVLPYSRKFLRDAIFAVDRQTTNIKSVK